MISKNDFKGFTKVIAKSLYCEITVLDKSHPNWGEFNEILKMNKIDRRKLRSIKEYTWVTLTLYRDDFNNISHELLQNFVNDINVVDDLLHVYIDDKHLMLYELNSVEESSPVIEKINEYKNNLSNAINNEDYLKAAKLRDKISYLEKKIKK